MKETWRDIIGYEGLYQVSNLGRVKSLPRNGTILTERIIKPSCDKGYEQVILSKDGIRKCIKVHRIVATSFVENKNNDPCINHKDENKLNNKAENLEWCSYSYNNSYNERAKKAGRKTRKKILCIELNTVFDGFVDAKNKTKINAGNICSCCNGKTKTAGGYHWRYA